MKAIILLAGYATRMYPLTRDVPKALLDLGGKPVIDYIAGQINNLPCIDTVYCVTNAKFYEHFCTWAQNAPVTAHLEVLSDGTTTNENRRGAIGDIQFTIEQKGIDDDLFVIAGDNFFTYDLRAQHDVFVKTGCDTIVAKRIDDVDILRGFAVAQLDSGGKVLDLVEKPPSPASDIGIFASYFYKRSTVPLFRQYLDAGQDPDPPGAFVQWLHKVRDVYAYMMQGNCYDIGTIDMYNQISQRLQKGEPL